MLTAGIEVSSSGVTFVVAEVSSEKITIVEDETLSILKGPRPRAYRLMRQRLEQLPATKNIKRVVFKASAAGTFKATKGMLEGAELRGVCLAAVPDDVEIKLLDKANVSRNFGSRKFDEYVQDDAYFKDNCGGVKLRKGSRGAALLLIVSRP